MSEFPDGYFDPGTVEAVVPNINTATIPKGRYFQVEMQRRTAIDILEAVIKGDIRQPWQRWIRNEKGLDEDHRINFQDCDEPARIKIVATRNLLPALKPEEVVSALNDFTLAVERKSTKANK